MRRYLVLAALTGFLALGLGCKSTAGRCDCNYDPANYALPASGMNYPTVGPSHTATPAAKPVVDPAK